MILVTFTRNKRQAKTYVWLQQKNHMLYTHTRVCARSLPLRLTLCDPMDCSPSDSSVQGILQARTLELVAMPSSRGSSRLRDPTQVSCISCISRQALYHSATWEAHVYTYMQYNSIAGRGLGRRLSKLYPEQASHLKDVRQLPLMKSQFTSV